MSDNRITYVIFFLKFDLQDIFLKSKIFSLISKIIIQ